MTKQETKTLLTFWLGAITGFVFTIALIAGIGLVGTVVAAW